MPTKKYRMRSTLAKKAAIQANVELGKISGSQELAQLRDLLETKWALEQDYFSRKLAAAENDMRMRQKLTDEERLAYEKFLTEKQKLDTQAARIANGPGSA